jgi:chaperonin GroES
MKLIPMGDRILVKPIKQEETKRGDLVIPETAQDKPLHGVVVAIGQGNRTLYGGLVPIALKPGWTVLYGPFPYTRVTVDGEDLIVMRESDVMAVVEA